MRCVYYIERIVTRFIKRSINRIKEMETSNDIILAEAIMEYDKVIDLILTG